MVCEKCQKKLSKEIVPNKWKEGASNTTEGGGRKINENKLLSKKNSRKLFEMCLQPYAVDLNMSAILWMLSPFLARIFIVGKYTEKLSHAPVVLDSLVPLNGKHGFLNVVEAFAMMAASLVSLFEFTSTSYAAARYGSATPVFNDSTALTKDDLYELRNCWATCFLDLFNPKNDYDDGAEEGS
ncbi:putative nucleobase-ascorbate transporter [Trifolium repens]|nr:putative nucleobase-ascorbate transporter [Trifolium repens]